MNSARKQQLDVVQEIPLDMWAAAKFAGRVPSIHTLRRWVREEKIIPFPRLYGRAYYVKENARYVSRSDPNYAKAVANESTS